MFTHLTLRYTKGYTCTGVSLYVLYFFFSLTTEKRSSKLFNKILPGIRKIHFWKKFGNAWICDLDFWHLLQNQWGYLYTHHITFARAHCNLETIPDRETSHADITCSFKLWKKKGNVGRVELYLNWMMMMFTNLYLLLLYFMRDSQWTHLYF